MKLELFVLEDKDNCGLPFMVFYLTNNGKRCREIAELADTKLYDEDDEEVDYDNWFDWFETKCKQEGMFIERVAPSETYVYAY